MNLFPYVPPGPARWYCSFLLVLLIQAGGGKAVFAAATPSQAHLNVGVAQVDITPDYPVRLSGFGFRRTESEGVTQKIWAKAMIIGDSRGGRSVFIATDNLGVPDSITRDVANRLGKHWPGFKREQLVVTATHTHTAPMLTEVAPTLFGMPIPPEHQSRIERYSTEFTDALEEAALKAAGDMRPALLEWGVGKVKFAVNRRTKGGPVDHDLPLLVVKDTNALPRAVLFTYACHCVTLSHNSVSGDWAGYAMDQIQAAFPGAIALASIGCGADANPDSGVVGDNFKVAEEQGVQISREVQRMMCEELAPVSNPPLGFLKRINLPLAPPRTRQEWENRATRNDAVGYHARVNLARLDAGETLPTSIEYPIQTWIFGEELAMVFLAGEVVVDYAIRFKREFDGSRIWIHAYANDAPCYIPSERVLKEGGYEGGGAMIYYDKPQVFAPGLEAKIMGAIHEQVPDCYLVLPGTEGSVLDLPNRPVPPFRPIPSW